MNAIRNVKDFFKYQLCEFMVGRKRNNILTSYIYFTHEEKNSNGDESETKEDIFSYFCKVSRGPQETDGQTKCRNGIGNIDPAMGEQHFLES